MRRTPRWLVPHFEQMLYDNAQLARVYLHASKAFGGADSVRYRSVAVGTLDYMLRELRRDDGAFASSQDADTEGEEGATFTWRAAEIRDVPGDEAFERFAAAYGVTDEGNWEGVTILSRVWPTRASRRAATTRRSRPRWLRRVRRSWRRGRPAAARPGRQGARRLERTRDRGIR